MTMVGYGKTDLTNVVKDPSFEEIAVSGGGFATLVQQGNFKSWLARNKADTGCLDLSPIIELQTNHAKQKALNGKQWTELDSACAFDNGENAGNIGLFQDLAVIKDHVYAISFGAKRRAEANTLQRMRMTWGGLLLFEQDTIQDDWTVFSMIQTSTSNGARIDFEETGYSDGYGTLLDDIRIYDLGLPVL